jgi:hypothetical protein
MLLNVVLRLIVVTEIRAFLKVGKDSSVIFWLTSRFKRSNRGGSTFYFLRAKNSFPFGHWEKKHAYLFYRGFRDFNNLVVCYKFSIYTDLYKMGPKVTERAYSRPGLHSLQKGDRLHLNHVRKFITCS